MSGPHRLLGEYFPNEVLPWLVEAEFHDSANAASAGTTGSASLPSVHLQVVGSPSLASFLSLIAPTVEWSTSRGFPVTVWGDAMEKSPPVFTREAVQKALKARLSLAPGGDALVAVRDGLAQLRPSSPNDAGLVLIDPFYMDSSFAGDLHALEHLLITALIRASPRLGSRSKLAFLAPSETAESTLLIRSTVFPHSSYPDLVVTTGLPPVPTQPYNYETLCECLENIGVSTFTTEHATASTDVSSFLASKLLRAERSPMDSESIDPVLDYPELDTFCEWMGIADKEDLIRSVRAFMARQTKASATPADRLKRLCSKPAEEGPAAGSTTLVNQCLCIFYLDACPGFESETRAQPSVEAWWPKKGVFRHFGLETWNKRRIEWQAPKPGVAPKPQPPKLSEREVDDLIDHFTESNDLFALPRPTRLEDLFDVLVDAWESLDDAT